MKLAEIDIAPVCPWKHPTEWLSVYHQVLSTDHNDWEAALHTLSRWVNLQCSIPAHVAASVPVLRARCLLHNYTDGASSSLELPACLTPALLVNWAVRIAVIEFVNTFVKGVEAEGSSKGQQVSLHQLAVEAGLPEDLIPLRNSLVHSTDVASNIFLEAQVVDCMWKFLKKNYWDVEHLVLRRRQELLAHAERRCSSVSTTTDSLRQHVAAIYLAVVTAKRRRKSTFAGGLALFKKLQEVTVECLEYVQVFSSEGKLRDRDARIQEVVRITVEGLLLAPIFVAYLHKKRETCNCGCPLDIRRVGIKKFLVYLLTEPPPSDLLCPDTDYADPLCRRDHYRNGISLSNHFFSILLEHAAQGSKTRRRALEWLQLLVSNCAPHAFPPATSCLRCPDHNLYLRPSKLGKVPAPSSGSSLRGEAVLHIRWSPIIWQMLNADSAQVVKHGRRLLPICLKAAEVLISSGRPAELREAAHLRMLSRVLMGGDTLSWKEYNSIFPNGRREKNEVRAEGWQKVAVRSAELLRRQQAFAFIGEVKPSIPLGSTVTKVEAKSQLPRPLLSAADDKESRTTSTSSGISVSTLGAGAPVGAETSLTDEMLTKPTKNHPKLSENKCRNSKNSPEDNMSVSTVSPKEKNEQKNFASECAKHDLSSPSTGLQENGILTNEKMSPAEKQSLGAVKPAPELAMNSVSGGVGRKLKRSIPSPQGLKKRKIE